MTLNRTWRYSSLILAGECKGSVKDWNQFNKNATLEKLKTKTLIAI